MKRPGFVVSGMGMIGIIVIAAIVSIALQWSTVLEEAMIDLTTSMHTFDYEVIDGEEVGNASLDTFLQLRSGAFMILVGVIMFGGFTLIFEKIKIISEGTAWKMVANGFVYLFFLMIFPWIWDTGAVIVEEGSKWIIDPDGNIFDKPKYILTKATGVCAEKVTEVKPDDFAGLDDPWRALTEFVGVGGGETIEEPKCNHIEERTFTDKIINVFLTFTSSIAVLILVFMTFIIGTGRLVLTDVFMVGFPIILMISLLPMFQKVTDHIKTGLVGLFIVPIFSALAITGGAAFLETVWCESAHVALDCVPPDALSGWFYSVSVLALITFMPVIIVPMLGSFTNSMSGIATGSVMMGGLGAMQTAVGGAKGIAGAARGISAAGGIGKVGIGQSTLEFAKGALSGGMASGGAAAMSTMGKMGSAGGLNIPQNVMHAPNIGSGGGASSTGSNIVESTGARQAGSFEQAFTNEDNARPAPIMGDNHELRNPEALGINDFTKGNEVLGDKKQTQAFLDSKHTTAYDNMSKEGKSKFDAKLLDAAKRHPAVVGKFFNNPDEPE